MSKQEESPRPEDSESDSGKRTNSEGWLKGAFSLTNPSSFAGTIVCNDDCKNCKLFRNGCAGKCVRWDDMVCKGCPCLASRYANIDIEPRTIDPVTGEEAPADPELLKLRAKRKLLGDGEEVSS